MRAGKKEIEAFSILNNSLNDPSVRDKLLKIAELSPHFSLLRTLGDQKCFEIITRYGSSQVLESLSTSLTQTEEMRKIKTIVNWPTGLKTFTHMRQSCDISTKDLETLISDTKVIPDLYTSLMRWIYSCARGYDSHEKKQKNKKVIVEILDLRWLYRRREKDFLDFPDFSKIMFWMPIGFKNTKFTALLLEEFWPRARIQMIRWIFWPKFALTISAVLYFHATLAPEKHWAVHEVESEEIFMKVMGCTALFL